MVGEISSGDTVMFAISSRKEETWVYNFCCFLFSALDINARVRASPASLRCGP